MPDLLWDAAAIGFLVLAGYFSVLALLIGASYAVSLAVENRFGGRERREILNDPSLTPQQRREQAAQYKMPTWFGWIGSVSFIALWLWSTPLHPFGFMRET